MAEKKQVDLGEQVARVQSLAERIRYQPTSKLPSEFRSELHAINGAVREDFDKPPAGWGELIEVTELMCEWGLRSPRNEGLTQHYHRATDGAAHDVLAAQQRAAQHADLVAQGKAMPKSEFDALSLAAQGAWIRSGNTIFD